MNSKQEKQTRLLYLTEWARQHSNNAHEDYLTTLSMAKWGLSQKIATDYARVALARLTIYPKLGAVVETKPLTKEEEEEIKKLSVLDIIARDRAKREPVPIAEHEIIEES